MAMPIPALEHSPTFWHDIVHDPLSDRPRLDYAAWLDEEGDPRGEFIEVQCRLAAAEADSQDPLWEWERREQELLAENEDAWVGDVRGLVDWWTFRRGFIEEVALPAVRFLQHAEQLFSHAPILEVHLSRAREHLDALSHCHWLLRLRHLDLSNNFVRDQGAKLLAQSPFLAEMHGLNLSSAALGDAAVEALAASPYLKNLRELYLCDNRIGAAGARALAFGPLAERLDVLHVRFNPLDADSAALLKRRFGPRVHW